MSLETGACMMLVPLQAELLEVLDADERQASCRKTLALEIFPSPWPRLARDGKPEQAAPEQELSIT